MKIAALVVVAITIGWNTWAIAEPEKRACGKCLERVLRILEEERPAVLRPSDSEYEQRLPGWKGDVVVDDLTSLKKARKQVAPQGLVLLQLSGDISPGLETLRRVPEKVQFFADVPITPADVEAIYGQRVAIDPTSLKAMQKAEEAIVKACKSSTKFHTPAEYVKASEAVGSDGSLSDRVLAAAKSTERLVVVVAHVADGFARFRDGSSLQISELPRNLWVIGCDTVRFDAKQPGLHLVTQGRPDFTTGLRAARTIARSFATESPTSYRSALLELQKQKFEFAVGALGMTLVVTAKTVDDRK